MRQGIHPVYREVVVKDMACGFSFLTRSTQYSKDTIVWDDGKEYPLIKVEISSASHPFFTGQQRFIDNAGRIERFNKRYQNQKKK